MTAPAASWPWAADDPRPLIVHVLYRFDTGGLENGVVNLINHLPQARWRHAVLALTEVVDVFRQRVRRPDVHFHALHKGPGHGAMVYPQVYRLLRQWRPALVHTRNLAALEMTVPAWAAGVPLRVHGEHGRDENDLDGLNRRLQRVRWLYKPFVHRYIALSRELAQYLCGPVGVAPARVVTLYNGVDTRRFSPLAQRQPIAGAPFHPDRHRLIGYVGRMKAVKNPLLLAHAFIRFMREHPVHAASWRLVMAGEGPQREAVQRLLGGAGMGDLAWLPGERQDVADWLRGIDLYVLPSLAEGISNTLLEAMASGLPVLATDVGGNRELVVPGLTGTLVPSGDEAALATALACYAEDPALRQTQGEAGRQRAMEGFSLDSMMQGYDAFYAHALRTRGLAVPSIA